MSENMPDAFSATTPLPDPKPGAVWDRRNRRPLSRIPGARANTLPVIKPGEKIFRINPDPPDDPRYTREALACKAGRDLLREWGNERDFDVAPRGKVPVEVTDAFIQQHQETLDRHREYARGVMREWGRRNGFDVRSRGEVPAEVRDAFMKANDIWTVVVASVMLPGANEFSQHYHVRQGGYTKKRTVYPHVVRREMGHELFTLLWEVR